MKQAFVVLGMHRSGTSSTAGVLAQLGAAAPKTLMTPAADNPKGFWESYAVSDLNDQILASQGSVWSDSRAFPVETSEPFIERGLEVLQAEFNGADPLVLKDPRICRLYPFWRTVLLRSGYQPVIVTPVRHPAQVQSSLTHRNGMDPEQARRLWLRHVLDAELYSRDDPRVVFLWSDLLADWKRELRKVEALIGADLRLDAPEVEARVADFISPDLQHHHGEGDDSLPAACRLVFDTLGALARDGDAVGLRAVLDEQRALLNASDSTVG